MKDRFGIIIAVLITTSATVAQAGTQATIHVKNGTGDKATFSYESFSGSLNPAPGDIEPSQTGVSILNSTYDSISSMRFVYTSGSKQCRFSASHSVNPVTNVPTFSKAGVSIGRVNATCNARYGAVMPAKPFNYTIQFEIR